MFAELSHVVSEGMVTYPGLPSPSIESHLTRADSRGLYQAGTEFAIDVIRMCGNTGTYLDSPWHRYADGGDLTSISLEQTVDVPAVVVAPRAGVRGIDASVLESVDVSRKAVLFRTGDSARFGTPAYGDEAHFVTEDAARLLVDRGATIVGIDAINIDAVTPNGSRPAHTLLLAAGIPIVEHLTGLDQLPESGALFTAVPLRIVSFGTISVRAFAKLP